MHACMHAIVQVDTFQTSCLATSSTRSTSSFNLENEAVDCTDKHVTAQKKLEQYENNRMLRVRSTRRAGT